ncbi:hypothetical protein [Burkholderia phage BCSR5]|nr:hypothetical protein [Burkholderia phage BCSR5]
MATSTSQVQKVYAEVIGGDPNAVSTSYAQKVYAEVITGSVSVAIVSKNYTEAITDSSIAPKTTVSKAYAEATTGLDVSPATAVVKQWVEVITDLPNAKQRRSVYVHIH